jgi:hypothetical protein
MTRFAKYIVFISAVVMVSWAALPVMAQSPGDIKITTNPEVAVPGHLLEPGTYWFRRALADEPTVYKIVGDNGRLVGFVQVIPTERVGRADTEVDVTAPDAAGVRVMQAWYGPGDTSGYELVYAKGDIRKLDQIAEMRSHSFGYSGQH